jgi:hypothetical protein
MEDINFKFNKMHTYQIHVLIQLLVSSTCFEHHTFIISKNILYMQYLWNIFHAEITMKRYIKLLFSLVLQPSAGYGLLAHEVS